LPHLRLSLQNQHDSTVGYGISAPALGYQNDDSGNCIMINLICALEALVGVLYSGFCGAVLFGKILRLQSEAQVIFSDPLVIRFGSVALQDSAHDMDDDTEETTENIPFPILEFRIVNRLFNEEGGEIMDASLSVVANINEEELSEREDNGNSSRDVYNKIHHFASALRTSAAIDEGRSNNLNVRQSQGLRSFFTRGNNTESADISAENASSRVSDKKGMVSFDEYVSAKEVHKHLFSRMSLEPSDHPFFKRVWLARHVLNEESPLLRYKVRRQIRRNDGKWPRNLNTAEAIRSAIQFNQILVSLTGLSNTSASDVYAQKI
jgi:hypothetical protein